MFVRDIAARARPRASASALAAPEGNSDTYEASLSGDGRFVVLESLATNLVPNGAPGIYVHDRQTGMTSALSTTSIPFACRFFRRSAAMDELSVSCSPTSPLRSTRC